MPVLPGLKTCSGITPMCTRLVGFMMPGQFGPTMVTPFRSALATNPMASFCGIKSVITTSVFSPASMASIMAAEAKRGGTYTTVALASCFFTASATVS